MADSPNFFYEPVPTPEMISFYRDEGFLHVAGFYDYEREIEPIQRDIHKLIGMIAADAAIDLGPRDFSTEEFDGGLPILLAGHRRLVGVLYDAVKKLPSYVRLACCEKHDVYARALLGSGFVGFAPRGYGIRMDNPGEDHYATQLHQDYVSQLSSQNAAVLWSPLRRTTPELGPLALYPRSHRDGIYPIVRTASGSRGLEIDNIDEVVKPFPVIAPEVAVGDCVFADFLLLHESGRNVSGRTRWAMISRYFDFLHPSGRAINWKGGLQEGNSFEVVHPELSRNA